MVCKQVGTPATPTASDSGQILPPAAGGHPSPCHPKA